MGYIARLSSFCLLRLEQILLTIQRLSADCCGWPCVAPILTWPRIDDLDLVTGAGSKKTADPYYEVLRVYEPLFVIIDPIGANQ